MCCTGTPSFQWTRSGTIDVYGSSYGHPPFTPQFPPQVHDNVSFHTGRILPHDLLTPTTFPFGRHHTYRSPLTYTMPVLGRASHSSCDRWLILGCGSSSWGMKASTDSDCEIKRARTSCSTSQTYHPADTRHPRRPRCSVNLLRGHIKPFTNRVRGRLAAARGPRFRKIVPRGLVGRNFRH